MAVRNLSVRVGSFGFQWPNAFNTGVPAGTTLTDYSGPGGYDGRDNPVVLDSMHIDSIDIRALDTANITLLNCLLTNCHIDCDSPTASVTAINCEINASTYNGPAVGFQNLTLDHCNIYGGITAVNMSQNGFMNFCWLHDQYLDPSSANHLGGFLCSGGNNNHIKDCRIQAQTPDNGSGGGESGTVQLYPDFAAVTNMWIDHCYIDWTTGGYAASLGYNPGKPGGPPSGIVVNNGTLFGRGPNGKGGVFGTTTSWLDTEPTNIFSAFWADDGTPVIPNT